jgi:hypothetical protein
LKLYKHNSLSGSGLDIANPWTMFNLSELSIAAKLYRQIHRDLSDVHAMLKSTNAMSAKENELLLALCENQAPLAWRKIWRGPRIATDFLLTVAQGWNCMTIWRWTQRAAALEPEVVIVEEGETPQHRCTHCNRPFTTTSNRNKHQRKCQKDDNQCKSCGHNFGNKGHLTLHIKNIYCHGSLSIKPLPRTIFILYYIPCQ